VQSRKKCLQIDAVLPAGILDRVEGGDRAADAAHVKIEKNTDGFRPLPHDGVDGVVELDRLDAFPHAARLTRPAHASLCRRNQKSEYVFVNFCAAADFAVQFVAAQRTLVSPVPNRQASNSN
jgi:hypothetical protein